VTGSSGPAAGSAAQEAARLLAAAEEWARTRAGRLLDDEHLATGSPACTTCPVCTAVTALRAVRPETVEHLLDAAASLVAALRSAAAPGTPGPGPRPGGGVQRIDVTEGEWD
jgi:hypothetical protein